MWWTSFCTQNNHSIGRNSYSLHVTALWMLDLVNCIYVNYFLWPFQGPAPFAYFYLNLSSSHNHLAPFFQPSTASAAQTCLSESFPASLWGFPSSSQRSFRFNLISDTSPPCIHILNPLNMFWKERVKCIRSQRCLLFAATLCFSGLLVPPWATT